jgi:hypothetical protein
MGQELSFCGAAKKGSAGQLKYSSARPGWHADWFAMTTCAFRHGLCFIPEMLSIINILPKSYYTAGRRKDEHRHVLSNILELLSTPPYADVRPKIQQCGALSLFGPRC